MKVISGGQTGVDRAALDVALTLGLPVGGWCPRGRMAEDGPIPDKYPLVETTSKELHVRTQRNVEASSATLIITRGTPTGGARFTAELATTMRRPLLIIDLAGDQEDDALVIAAWLEQVQPRVLNVAGPRESGYPGITTQAAEIFADALRQAGIAPHEEGSIELRAS